MKNTFMMFRLTFNKHSYNIPPYSSAPETDIFITELVLFSYLTPTQVQYYDIHDMITKDRCSLCLV